MKQILSAAALALVVSPLSAAAASFDFSYTFGSGNVITGSLTGDVDPDGLTLSSVDNVSVSLNGLPFVGNPHLFAQFSCDGCPVTSAIPPVVSFDAALNNFFFVDTDYPNVPTYKNYFFLVHGIDSFSDVLAFGYVSPDGSVFTSVDGRLSDLGTWTLTPVTNPIPEPEAYAMLLAGLLLLGATRLTKRIGNRWVGSA